MLVVAWSSWWLDGQEKSHFGEKTGANATEMGAKVGGKVYQAESQGAGPGGWDTESLGDGGQPSQSRRGIRTSGLSGLHEVKWLRGARGPPCLIKTRSFWEREREADKEQRDKETRWM